MNNKIVRDVLFGMLITLVSMCLIAFVVAKTFYAYVFDNFRGINQLYIVFLGYGFFGNVFLYSIFWYLKREYVQRGIIIVTMVTSFIFIINRLL